MTIIIILSVLIVILSAIGVFATLKYLKLQEEVSKVIFKNAKFFGIGKFILDDILKTKYKDLIQKRYSKIKDYYTQLYGKAEADKLTEFHFYQSMTISFVTSILVLVVAVGVYNDYLQSNVELLTETSTISRPDYAEVSEPVQYLLEVEEDGKVITKEIELTINSLEPTPAEIDNAFEELDAYYEAYFDQVLVEGNTSSDLYLDHPFKALNVRIVWTSSHPTMISRSGELNPIYIPEGGQDVTLSARYNINGSYHDYEQMLRIYPRDLLFTDVLDIAAKETKDQISDKSLEEIDVITQVGDESNNIDVKWYRINGEAKSRETAFVVLLVGLFLIVLVNRVNDSQMNDKIKAKSQSIQMDFPVFADKFILYIYCGIAPEQALVKYLSNVKEDTELTLELKQTLKEIEFYGIDPREAFLSFGKRTRITEILKFSTLIAQMIKKGDDDIQESLQKLVAESWQEKRKLVLEKGTKASTKLLLPMLVLLVLVLMIVLTPAFSTLGGM